LYYIGGEDRRPGPDLLEKNIVTRKNLLGEKPDLWWVLVLSPT